MNIFDYRGPEFLQFYVLLMIGGWVIAMIVRWMLRTPGDDPPRPLADLKPYEVACLTGGAGNAVDAAIASLVHRNLLAVGRSGRTVKAVVAAPADLDELERTIYQSAAMENATVRQVRAAGLPVASRIFAQVADLGLVMDDSRAWTSRLLSAGVMAVVLLVGLRKIFVGLDRDRPVGFLIALCVVTAVTAIVMLAARPLRTRRGQRHLSRLKARSTALRYTARQDPNRLEAPDFAMVMGLFGVGVLAGTPYGDLHDVLERRNATTSSSCSSCGSGSSCGGGSCGGGCGGCGGGD